MFRSSTILRELVQSLAKVTLLLKPELRGLSPRVNYTDRAAAAGLRS